MVALLEIMPRRCCSIAAARRDKMNESGITELKKDIAKANTDRLKNIQMSRYLENWHLEAGLDLEASDF